MPELDAREVVDAPRSTLWEVLCETIDHPDRFSETIGRVRVHRGGPSMVDRTMDVAWPHGERSIRESIAIDAGAGVVRCTLVDDPVYEGTTTLAIVDGSDGMVVTSAMRWVPRSGEEPGDGPDWAAQMRRFVRDVRAAAEAF